MVPFTAGAAPLISRMIWRPQAWWRSFAGLLLPYLQIVRLLPSISRPLTVAVAVGVLMGAVLPVAFTVAAGTLVGSIPATIESGFDSTSGRFTLLVLAVVAVLFLA
ncbi:MAG TPA: hypothetical protein VGW38_19260, partial [Chloroflexota bacterium]|nr:hypothetical protein [Chloroflexota bacterium]